MAATVAMLALAASSMSASAAFTSERFAFQTSASDTLVQALPSAEHVLNLTGKTRRPSYKAAAFRSFRKKTSNYTGVLEGALGDTEYLTPITFGSQHFMTLVDTGSSDTWVPEKGFECFNLTSYPEPSSECGFGSKGFDPSKSKTFENYPNHNFNISYGSGEFLTGTVGFETVTVGGLTVSRQEFGVVNKAAWEGDGVNSGLLGLAYPALTDVFKGTNPDKDNFTDPTSHEPYPSFVFTAIKEKKLKKPILSLALNRGTFVKEANSTSDKNLGIIAFGGIAPVPITNTTVTVPIEGFKVFGFNGPVQQFYTIDVDEFVFEGSKKRSKKTPAFLDSGTWYNWVPQSVAKDFNANWKPAAKFDPDQGVYYVSCNATAPALSVVIGGVKFPFDSRDLIIPVTNAEGEVICQSSVWNAGSEPSDQVYILGGVFMHNVVTTFNLETNTTTLTQRQPY